MRCNPSARRWQSSALALMLLASSTVAAVAAPCLRPAEKTAFDITALKSELMVVSVTCQAETQYNMFVTHFRSDLQGADRSVTGYFNRSAGGRADAARDNYITSLANAQSDEGLKQGNLFCRKHMPMLSDAIALNDSKALAAFASSQTLANPVEATACPTAPGKPAAKPAAK